MSGYEVVWDPQGYHVTQTVDADDGRLAERTTTHYANPCAALRDLRPDEAVTENDKLLITSILDSCAQYRAFQLGKGPVPTQTTPPTPKAPLPTLPPPVEAPPIGGDSPALQGAPDVAATAVVTELPANRTVNAARPTDAAYRQQEPLTSADLLDILRSLTVPPDDDQALLRRIDRNDPEPGQPHPTHTQPARNAAVDGDPVDLYSGAFTMSATDLVVPSPHLPIRFDRDYRSGRTYFGPFGHGWDHNWNTYLRPLRDGRIAWWTGRLREHSFSFSAAGWEPEPGEAVRLSEDPGRPGVFDLTQPGGVRWRFERPPGWPDDARIPLTTIADRHGNTIAVAYDPEGRVAAVLDDANRGLHFRYGTCGLLEEVRDHTAARTVRYEHDPDLEHLVRVTLPAIAGFPRGVAATYEYDADNPHAAMRHNITTVLDAHDRVYVENEYAAPGTGWAFNSVQAQSVGGFIYTFDYEQIQYVPEDVAYLDLPASRTTVQQPSGAMHIHTFNYRGEELDHRFRVGRDRTWRVISSQHRYDTAGNVVESVNPNGIRQISVYDHENPDPCARRNLLRRELAAPGGVIPSRVILRAEYDPLFQLPRWLADETGAVTRLRYDFDDGDPAATGRVTRIELPPATRADGSLQGAVTHVDCNRQGQLVATVSPTGSRAEYRYITTGPHRGRVASIRDDATGTPQRTDIDYDAAGFVRSVTDPGERVTGYQHNTLGQVETVTTPQVDGHTAQYRRYYGDDGTVIRSEHPRGQAAGVTAGDDTIVDLFDHNILGALTRYTASANSTTPRTWRAAVDHHGNPVDEEDPAGLRTHRLFDERGLLLRQTVAVGTPDTQTSSYGYDRAGALSRAEAPDGTTMHIARDVWGRPTVIRAHGGEQRLRWGPGNRLLAATVVTAAEPGRPERLLRRDEYRYDERGRLTEHDRVINPDDPPAGTHQTSYDWDADDHLTAIHGPRGSHLTFHHDGSGRLTQVENDRGEIIRRSYDAAGDLTAIDNTRVAPGGARGTTDHYRWDGRGRLRGGDGAGWSATFDYDDQDLLTRRTDAAGGTTELLSDAHGDLSTISTADPAGAVTTLHWQHDRCGRVTHYSGPTGDITHWERDLLGRVRTMTTPNGAIYSYAVNAAGTQTTITTPGGVRISTEHHGPAGRLTHLSATGGGEGAGPYTFDYDPLGRLLRAAGPAGSIDLAYDGLDRVIREQSAGKTVHTRYDDTAGTRTLVYPDGRAETTSHDAAGRATRVDLTVAGSLGGTAGETLLEIQYDAGRRPAVLRHGNGIETWVRYDNAGRVMQVEHRRDGLTLDAAHDAYDTHGRRAVHQTLGPAPHTTVHTYDLQHRLTHVRTGFAYPPLPPAATDTDHAATVLAATTAAATATHRQDYQIDQADARVSRSTTTPTTSNVTTDNPDTVHRPTTSSSGAAITYRPDGARTSDGTWGYTYDALGRIRRITSLATGAVHLDFVYDALGRIGSGTIDGAPFRRWHADNRWIHEEHQNGSTRQASPHPLDPQPLCVIDPWGPCYPLSDRLLTTLLVTNAHGKVLEHHRHGPFGEPTIVRADGVTPVDAADRFPDSTWRGMPALPGTDLYQSPHRPYDPDTGTFLAPDPLQYADGPNTYAYAAHNPVDYCDPSGRAKQPIQDATAPPQSALARWLHQDSTTAWWVPPHPADVFTLNPARDTGSTLLNYGVNTWISATNFLAAALNAQFRLQHNARAAIHDTIVQPIVDTLGISPTEMQALHTYLAIEGAGLFESIGSAATGAQALLTANRGLFANLARAPVFFTIGATGSLGGTTISTPTPTPRAAAPSRIAYIGRTRITASTAWSRYQIQATGSRFEHVFRLFRRGRFRDVLVDGIDGRITSPANTDLIEAKLGDMGQMWNPEREAHIIRQAHDYLDIADYYGFRSVEYRVSTPKGARRLTERFSWEFPAEMASGRLRVVWAPP